MDIKRNNKCLLTPDKCPRLSCAKHFDGRKFLIAYYTKIFSYTESFFIEEKTLTWLFIRRFRFISPIISGNLHIYKFLMILMCYILFRYLYFKKNNTNNFMQGRLLISRIFVSLIGLCNMQSLKVKFNNYIQL